MLKSINYPLASLVAFSVLMAGCEREERQFRVAPPAARLDTVTQSELFPGMEPPPSKTQVRFEQNAWAVSQGQRLYNWFNCSGCHFQGGGGIGPPFMDDKWIYGSDPENIFSSIVEGRPNGMPSFRGRIPDHQVWQIVGYVRSLGNLAPPTVKSSRSDHMQRRPIPQSPASGRPSPF